MGVQKKGTEINVCIIVFSSCSFVLNKHYDNVELHPSHLIVFMHLINDRRQELKIICSSLLTRAFTQFLQCRFGHVFVLDDILAYLLQRTRSGLHTSLLGMWMISSPSQSSLFHLRQASCQVCLIHRQAISTWFLSSFTQAQLQSDLFCQILQHVNIHLVSIFQRLLQSFWHILEATSHSEFQDVSEHPQTFNSFTLWRMRKLKTESAGVP